MNAPPRSKARARPRVLEAPRAEPVRVAAAPARSEAHAHAPETLAAVARLGYDFYLEDRFEEAAIIFEGLASITPRDPYNHRALAETALALTDLPKAMRAANAALTLAPDTAIHHQLRARILFAAGRSAEAKQDLLRAIELGDHFAKDLLRTI